MSQPMTMHRSFAAEIDGLGRLEWNVQLTVTCPKCGNHASVSSSEGGTRVECPKCDWLADTLIDAFTAVSLVLRQAP